MYRITTATRKIAAMKGRIRVVQGGTSGSKTISILLYLIHLAQSDKSPTLTSVVSESIPHLKRGAMRDFKNIMKAQHYWSDALWNATDSIYTFETGSQIEFFSTDNGDKLRGARRDRCFMNEANNCTRDAFDQLEVRTREFFFLDYNPTSEFWAYEVMKERDDTEFIILTYRDNEALDPAIVEAIEKRKTNKNWWKVYGEGQLGEVETRIFTGWTIIDAVPEGSRILRRGLDFGYTNDPTAIVGVYKYNDGYILDEELYRKGMSNKDIADYISVLPFPSTLIIADSAEPKSIDELKLYNVSILPAEKGPGSVIQGIQRLQSVPIYVTKRSTNLIKEYRNYLWLSDKNGKILNEPTPGNDHCFSGDTLVWTENGKRKIEDLVGTSGYLWSRDRKLCRYENVRATRFDVETVSIEFDDGHILTVTDDHLLLRPDNVWVEAGLLKVRDSIQSVMYENHSNIQREKVHPSQWRKILEQWKQKNAQVCMGDDQRANTSGTPYPSHRRKPSQQRHKQSRTTECTRPSIKSLDTRDACCGAAAHGSNTSTYKEVAQVKRGEEVALVTWEESVPTAKASRKGVRSLSQKIFNYATGVDSEVLPSELQDESETKKVVRITRGFSNVVYNLDVEGTHCLWANGVIAHNCIDSARYSIQSLYPSHTESEEQLQIY